MLPPGHIAAGYLTAYAVVKAAHPAVTPHEINLLLAAGAFFGFAPDIDMFYAFWKRRSLKTHSSVSHRDFWPHAPLLWLIAGLAVFFLSNSLFWRYVGLLLWLCPWSHFAIDSIEHGIMWLWPLRKKKYALMVRTAEADMYSHEPVVKFYWHLITRVYTKTPAPYLEIILIAAACVTFFIR